MPKLASNEVRLRIHQRIRKTLNGTPVRPRLAVFRSNKHIYAQVIDDAKGTTLTAASSLEADAKKDLKNGGNVAVTGPRDIRSEVLRLAARHDRALGEEFLSKLKIEKQQEATDAANKAPSNPFDAPEAARH